MFRHEAINFGKKVNVKNDGYRLKVPQFTILQMKSMIDNKQSYLTYHLILWTTYNDYMANILILHIPILSIKCKIDKIFVHHNISLLFTTLYRHKCGMSLSAKVYQFKSFRPIPRNLSQRQMSEYFFVVATFETFVFSSL